MDLKVSQKEERLQPGIGPVDVPVSDVFDLYLDLDADTILNADILDGAEELQQAAYFASIKQRGSDPLAPNEGVQWAELMLGEVTLGIIMLQIKEAVRQVSSNCNVTFSTTVDEQGRSVFTYSIQVVQ